MKKLICAIAVLIPAIFLFKSSFAVIPPPFQMAAPTPLRSLNQTFTPNASKFVYACYTFEFTCSLSVAGSCSNTIQFRSDTNATPTTVQMEIGPKLTLGIGVVVATTVGGPDTMCWLVPPGYNVRLVATGSPTPTITRQSENHLF